MLDKKKSFISAVVYVCNNSDVIEEFLQKLSETLKENFEKFEIICVDDASHDNSAELIKKQGSQLGSNALSIVKMSCYQGLEAAMHAGVDLSIGDFVFEFDSAHMDYPQGLIMEVYEKCLSGFDIVAAGTASNRISSKIFYRVYN
ncbi:MAG: glycosyltransferase, partial [Oscillospiraceae bacterium]|nr:glycosyltransferase [Oscillospiraceae bacterium]